MTLKSRLLSKAIVTHIHPIQKYTESCDKCPQLPTFCAWQAQQTLNVWKFPY